MTARAQLSLGKDAWQSAVLVGFALFRTLVDVGKGSNPVLDRAARARRICFGNATLGLYRRECSGIRTVTSNRASFANVPKKAEVHWMSRLFRFPADSRHCRVRGLPVRCDQPCHVWFLSGVPACAAVLAILWLMIARPEFRPAAALTILAFHTGS